jgi:AcrR family transcriptional regulator
MSPRNAATNQTMRAQSRRAILDAAAQVFGEVGPQNATTAAIAERAGVAKGLVFAYFESKDALLEAVIQDRLNEALQYWHDLPPLTGAELLTHIANRAVDRAIAHPDAFRLYFSLFFQPGASDAVGRTADRIKPQLEQYYRVLAIALKEAGSSEPNVDAVLFQAGLNGLVQNLVIQPDLAKRPKLFPRARLVSRLVEAFASPGTGRR